MKRNGLNSILLSVIVIMMGACGSTVWDDVPGSITTFVLEYFPNMDISSYVEAKDGSSTVVMKDGPTLKFNSGYEWTSVNGNGNVLPQNFLFDRLPARLYDYIEELEQQNDVYAVSRGEKDYRVEFHDTYVVYDAVTETVSYPSAEAKNASES